MDGQGNYFDSYDNIEVHSLMLRDDLRVAKYREAILGSKQLFKDKVRVGVKTNSRREIAQNCLYFQGSLGCRFGDRSSLVVQRSSWS
jgi:hypothetical protein